MRVRDIDLPNYLFEIKEEDLNESERDEIIKKLDKEMTEIFFGINVSNM
jgi:S-adenosylmethionine decarboxylase